MITALLAAACVLNAAGLLYVSRKASTRIRNIESVLPSTVDGEKE